MKKTVMLVLSSAILFSFANFETEGRLLGLGITNALKNTTFGKTATGQLLTQTMDNVKNNIQQNINAQNAATNVYQLVNYAQQLLRQLPTALSYDANARKLNSNQVNNDNRIINNVSQQLQNVLQNLSQYNTYVQNSNNVSVPPTAAPGVSVPPLLREAIRLMGTIVTGPNSASTHGQILQYLNQAAQAAQQLPQVIQQSSSMYPSNNMTYPSNNMTYPSNNMTYPSNNMTTYPSNNMTTYPSNNMTTYPSNNMTTYPSNNMTTYPSNNMPYQQPGLVQ